MFTPSVLYFGNTLNRDQIDADIREYFGRFYGVSYQIADVVESRSTENGEVTYRYKLHYQALSAVKKPGEQFAQVKEREGDLPSKMVLEPSELSWQIKEIGVER